jgi:hypothetical protein
MGVAAMLLCICSQVEAAATILNLNSKGRIPGESYVVFKSEADLRSVPKTGLGAPTILPDVLPTSMERVRRLASALCAAIQAQVKGINFINPNAAAFIIKGASDQAVRDVLAKDPRIAEISADIALGPIQSSKQGH